MRRPIVPFAFLIAARPEAAQAHATEGGFVLLLPTGHYMAAGVAAVALTVLLVSVLPGAFAARLFRPLRLGLHRRREWLRCLPGPAGFAAFVAAMVLGLLGPHDPTRNLLSLTVWTALWALMPLVHAVAGDLWCRLNPWVWPLGLLRRAGLRPVLHLPCRGMTLVALASFLGFAAVLLAHPAPADPRNLAAMAAGYWALHFGGAVVFGPRWLRRAEGFALLFALYARLAPLAVAGGRWRLGLPGWRLIHDRPPSAGVAAFAVAMLAVGSFDGVNETFLWIAALGFNPLEFPGRSAVVAPNLAGLALAVPALLAVFAASVRLGLRLAGAAAPLRLAIAVLAPALLPIALGYHVAHYLPATLVDAQALALALNDPLGQGADLLGLGHRHVTTGFLTALDRVRVIWLAQAGAVVAGHVLAVLLGHALALRLLAGQRQAALSQLPLAGFMLGWTLLGLWLLATPRGA